MVDIKTGHRPGLLGRIVEMHASYYACKHSFGSEFEVKVASEMAEFLSRIDNPLNEIWYAETDGEITGSISIDGDDLGHGIGHLRWFIVAERSHGHGIGRELLNEAIGFADTENFEQLHLWTFSDLTAARKLYEQVGFSLQNEVFGNQWGKTVREQKFVRQKPSD